MKKLLCTLLVIGSAIGGFAQTGISYGITLGLAGNESKYAGGSSDASALFHNNDFGQGSLAFTARYFFDEHWSIQSGMGLSSIGFEYGLAKDYSLLKKDDHYTQNNMSISVVQVPVTAIYAFKPNCKNNRFFVGLGASTMNNFENVNKTEHSEPKGDASSNSLYMDQTVTADQFIVVTGQVMAGVEKTLKQGGILQFGFIANLGFSDIASSTVSYTVDNKQYTHTFTNQGDYCGFRLSYYFKPLGSN